MLSKIKKIAKAQKNIKSCSGQALVEFLLLMPILIALLWYMLQVSMAINASIVGQKHARAQVFSKMFNHRAGPGNTASKDIGGDGGSLDDLGSLRRSAFYIGVSRDVIDGSTEVPAPVFSLGVGPNPKVNPNADDSRGEIAAGSLRQRIRVRTAFGICTHRKFDPATMNYTDFCAE
jgi:hypothetical protein